MVAVLSLSGIVAMSAGCSDDACGPDVTKRLRDECSLVLGPGGRCDQANPDQDLELQQELCTISGPDLDSTCLLEETCEAIQMGACSNGGGRGGSSDAGCRQDCWTAQVACTQTCAPRALEMCTDCLTTCAETYESCRDAC